MFKILDYLFENVGIKKLSFFFSFIFLAGLIFFYSSSYKSVSIISVQDQDTQTNISSSLINSFVNNSPESLHQLKSFLESNDASHQFAGLINTDEFYKSKDIRILSRFGTFFSNRFHDYYLDITNFSIMDESNTIEIETFGFSPEQAMRANIALIYIASEFFDQRERLSASIALAKKRCELAISKSADINDVFIDPTFNDAINIDDFDSANSLISSKSAAFYDKCLNYELVEDSVSPSLPLSALNDVNSSSSKILVSEIFDSKMNTLSITDNIIIIAEPIIPIQPEKKRLLIKTLFFFLTAFLILLSTKVLFKVRDNFIS